MNRLMSHTAMAASRICEMVLLVLSPHAWKLARLRLRAREIAYADRQELAEEPAFLKAVGDTIDTIEALAERCAEFRLQASQRVWAKAVQASLLQVERRVKEHAPEGTVLSQLDAA